MGLSIRTLDDGWVDLGDCDLKCDPAKGEIIGAMDTERYSCGDTIYFDGQARTEIVDDSEISDLIGVDVLEIIEVTEVGYIIKKSNEEKVHIEISEIPESK